MADSPFTSYGYEGFISPAPVWGLLQQAMNHQYFHSGGYIAAVSGQTRQVHISAGWEVGGVGIYNVLQSGGYTISYDEPASGTKWYLNVARQDMVNHVTTIESIDCGTAQYRPNQTNVPLPAFNKDYEGLWDIPHSLVSVTKGQTAIGQIIDLRSLGIFSGRYECFDLNVMQYQTENGLKLYMDENTSTGSVWHRTLNGHALRWREERVRVPGVRYTSGNVVVSGRNGFQRTGPTQEAYVDNGMVDLYVELRRTGRPVEFSNNQGALSDFTIATLNERVRPATPRVVHGDYYSIENATYGCTISILPSGDVKLISGAPFTTLRKTPGTGFDLHFSDTYNRRTG